MHAFERIFGAFLIARKKLIHRESEPSEQLTRIVGGGYAFLIGNAEIIYRY